MTAPARVFEDQGEFNAAFERGELDRDVVVVVRNQGPRANGMPELQQLTPHRFAEAEPVRSPVHRGPV